MKLWVPSVLLLILGLGWLGYRLAGTGVEVNQERSIDSHPVATSVAKETQLPVRAPVKMPPVSADQTVAEADEATRLRAELKATQRELEALKAPLDEPMRSSMVNAELDEDETLVLGGYARDDGRYEVTLFSPEATPSESGTISVQSRVLLLDPETMAAVGLEGLATQVRNTLQHGEAWGEEEIQTLLKTVARSDGVDLLSAPRVVAREGQPFAIEVGDGEERYELRGEVERTNEDRFGVQVRVQREEGQRLGETAP